MSTMFPTRRSRLRFATAALVIALIPSAALLPGAAYARINGPVGDTFSAGCLMLQNKGDALISEYKNASNERREQILTELRNNGRTWREIGCQAVFGDISRLMPKLPRGPAEANIGGMSLMHDDDAGDNDHGDAPHGGGDIFLY